MIDGNRNPTSLVLRRIAVSVLTVLLVGLVFLTGYVTGAGIPPQALINPYAPVGAAPVSSTDEGVSEDDFEIFWEVWNTVESRYYYDLPSSRERVYGAINGLMESLGDEHSGFIDPAGADFMRERMSGSFEGIGAVVETAPDGGVYIIRVFSDSPAETAGVRAGDVVIAVDGTDVTGKTLDEGVQLIRGQAGTSVELTIFREGTPDLLLITVTRARIEFPTVEYRMLEGDVGYIALYDFYSLATLRTREALQDLKDQGARAIIFDLRDNGGGYLNQAVDVADLFLDQGLILIQRDVDGNERDYRSNNGDVGEELPLVVLINKNSASASEIVAGAIKDRDRGTLIGVTSFGKGSVQTLYDLSDGSVLRLTTANWFTPDDVSISENGIDPDIEVEQPLPEDGQQPHRTLEDAQLDAALRYLLNELGN